MEFASDARGNRVARHSVDEDLDAVIETRTHGGTEADTCDPAGQLASVTGGPAPVTIEYGPRGNRTRTTTLTGAVDSTYNPNGSIATLSDGNGTASFAYDAAGRRTAVEVVDSNDDPLAAITTAYDAAGRTTVARDDGTATFSTTRSWDGDGNLTRLVHSNGGFPAVQDFLWDTTGGLPRVVDSYLYGALHARHDLTNQYLSIELDAGPAGTVLQWYGYDAVGSAVDPNDNPNILDGPDTHDPWGTPTPGITTHPTGLYRGEHRYGDLIHLRARQYHPETAQFTTPDPLDGIDGTPTVANPYHYTDNDPLNKTDPTGMRPGDRDLGLTAFSEFVDRLRGYAAEKTRECTSDGWVTNGLDSLSACVDRRTVNVAATDIAGWAAGSLPGGIPNPSLSNPPQPIEGNSGWRVDWIDDTNPARHVMGYVATGFHHTADRARQALDMAEAAGRPGSSEQDRRSGRWAIDRGHALSRPYSDFDDFLRRLVSEAGDPGNVRERTLEEALAMAEPTGTPWECYIPFAPC